MDGIIGSNMLRSSVIQFDDVKKNIIITNNAKHLSLKKIPYQPMELTPYQSNPFIKILIKKGDNSAVDKILFDSGADGFYEMSISAYNWFKEKADVVNIIAESEGSYTYGFHGMADIQHQFALNIPNIVLNKDTFKDVIVTTTNSNQSRIGSELLQYGKVTLDYPKKRFYFEPYATIKTKDIAERLWSISPTLQNKKMVVGIIWDKSLENQINLGDEILNFNGIDYKSMEFCDIVMSERKFTNNIATVELKDIKTGAIKKVEIKRL